MNELRGLPAGTPYRQPLRIIHLALEIGPDDYWVLLDCGHITRTNDKYMGVDCPLTSEDRRWTSKEFKKEFRTK